VRNALAAPLKAAAATAFIVGVVLLLLNPPSLSGAGGLAAMVAGFLALMLLGAWGAVALTGRDAMSEPEFERIVRRSEELAREPALAARATEFDLLVADAIDRLPEEFRELLEDTPVVISRLGSQHRAYCKY
jgi:hypothetical protein